VAYHIGDKVKLTATFKDETGALADPTTVVFRALGPSASFVYTTPDSHIVRDSIGVYHVILSTDVSGDWAYRFEGTGALTAATERSFFVEKSRFY
jgi:hypothetical protein